MTIKDSVDNADRFPKVISDAGGGKRPAVADANIVPHVSEK